MTRTLRRGASERGAQPAYPLARRLELPLREAPAPDGVLDRSGGGGRALVGLREEQEVDAGAHRAHRGPRASAHASKAGVCRSSEIDTPRKSSRSRSSPVAIRRDRTAGRGSSAGYTAELSMTRSTPARIAQRNGASSTRRSSLAGTSIRTAAASVLTPAAPKPGKCLAVAATRRPAGHARSASRRRRPARRSCRSRAPRRRARRPGAARRARGRDRRSCLQRGASPRSPCPRRVRSPDRRSPRSPAASAAARPAAASPARPPGRP